MLDSNGIKGNERANLAAKSALNLNPDTINILSTDFKHEKLIKYFMQNGSNNWIITQITNYTKLNPYWKNGDQLLENQERNK